MTSDRSLEPDTLVVDIGGGSTELVLGGPGGVSSSTSLQLGCVRMTERFLTADPPTAEQLEACAAHVRSCLPALAPARAIGVAGTVTTLAAIDLGLETHDAERIHGHVLGRDVHRASRSSGCRPSRSATVSASPVSSLRGHP